MTDPVDNNNSGRAMAAVERMHESDDLALQGTSKRARTAASTDGESTIFSFEWPNDPVSRVETRDFHDRIQITSTHSKNPMVVRRGDAVFLANERGATMVLYVEGFSVDRSGSSDDSSGSPVKMQGRWFLGHHELVTTLARRDIEIQPESKTFLDRLQHNELVLTNLREEHDIATIEKICDVYYFQRTGAPSMNSLAGRYLCRYRLKFDPVERTVEWGDWDVDIQAAVAAAQENATVDTLSSDDEGEHQDEEADEDDEDSASASSDEAANRPSTIQEGEGTALRGDIQVGSNFQMKVGPFIPGQMVVSRNPKCIYKAHRMSDGEMTDFLNRVADVHNEYLKRHGLTMDEPYSPLRHDQVEEIMRESPDHSPPTGSFMSTAAMLGGDRSRLSKECSADAILEILSDHDYDTDKALTAIKADFDSISVGWSRVEKEFFDDGFRRHQGALRLIARSIGPTKSIPDVIDYYYRYKIPDQFRKYQDKKREQAVKMVECIESRKYHESLSNNENNGSNGGGKHWSEKPVASIADSREERLRKAKKLLLDVKDAFGRDVMIEVGSVIRQLQNSYEPEARDVLFLLLRDQPTLQKRFLEFLPKHF